MSDPSHKSIAIVEKTQQESLSPLVRTGMEILSKNPNPETLERLLAVQEQWERNEAKKYYTRALVELKRDLPTVLARDTKVAFQSSKGGVSYTHASLGAVVAAITEPLTRHGFSLAWEPSTQAQQVTVTCRLTHAGGHSEAATISAPIDTSGSKSPAQGVASTITLLQRYTALSLLGIATTDMPEPVGEATPPDPTQIEAARNMKAAAALKKYGKTREEAEKFLGCPVKDWTRGDLEKLRGWLRPEKKNAE